jgi:nicotinate-nucleotide adenylyltransferase
MKFGLFGGSFNPVHHGHLIVVRAVAEQVGLQKVFLLPSAHPPHKTGIDSDQARHREAMIRLAIEGEPLFDYSDFDLRRPGPTFTIDTVDHFTATLPGASLHWIIGADSLVDLVTWHRASQLVDRCTILTAGRPAASEPDRNALLATFTQTQVERLLQGIVSTPLIDISSSQIRLRVRTGRSIRFLVPDAVAAYISQNNLYRSTDS